MRAFKSLWETTHSISRAREVVLLWAVPEGGGGRVGLGLTLVSGTNVAKHNMVTHDCL